MSEPSDQGKYRRTLSVGTVQLPIRSDDGKELTSPLSPSQDVEFRQADPSKNAGGEGWDG